MDKNIRRNQRMYTKCSMRKLLTDCFFVFSISFRKRRKKSIFQFCALAGILHVITACSEHHDFTQGHLQPALCGGISDQKIIEIVHLSAESKYKNSLGCSWSVLEIPGAVEFSVYRDSNYLKEMSYDKIDHGIVKPYKFKKYTGIMSTTEDDSVCELIVPQGNDFVVWTVERVTTDYDSCQVGETLMNMSQLE